MHAAASSSGGFFLCFRFLDDADGSLYLRIRFTEDISGLFFGFLKHLTTLLTDSGHLRFVVLGEFLKAFLLIMHFLAFFCPITLVALDILQRAVVENRIFADALFCPFDNILGETNLPCNLERKRAAGLPN